ncbi:MAG: magnesium/cobalt transporter CorA [Paracoccus sp. (in: a-proteobacteria)]
MIQAWAVQNQRLCPIAPDSDQAVWWDLLAPAPEEILEIEACFGLSLPTREEMMEIEATSRLYSENGGHFMTVLVPSQTDGDDMLNAPVTFIVIGHRLITLRYSEPRAFHVFPLRATRADIGLNGGLSIMLELSETIIDRLADVLERVEQETDRISKQVLSPVRKGSRSEAEWRTVLAAIGSKGGITSKIRGCLMTFERMLAYLMARLTSETRREIREQLKALAADVRSLTDQAEFKKVTFLLDATLGMINIEQNATIKIFSVVSVVFLPPTLVASIYGMNFDFIPELGWHIGYPFALAVMILSAMLPYLYFKRRGWL